MPMSVIRVLVSIALFAIAFIVILDNLGVNVTALVAGLGIGGIAIGLAAQGIFSDLFAALAILFDKPFKRGDVIRYDNSVGTVERIGLKTTRLRSLTGEQMIMANTKLLEREIHNLADGRSRRMTLTFGLVYRTPADKLERVPELARAAVEERKGCKFVRCTLSALAPSSLDHELLFDDRQPRPGRDRRPPLGGDHEPAQGRSPRKASSSPTRPRPPTPPRPTARWSCPTRRPRRRPKPDADRRRSTKSAAAIGTEVGVSDWLTIDQDAHRRVRRRDRGPPVHPCRPRGRGRRRRSAAPIAHGFLSLSMLSRMARRGDAGARQHRRWRSITASTGSASSPRSGPASGSAAASRSTAIEEKAPGQLLLRHSVTVEIEGVDKPALTAQWLGLLFV